MLAEQPFAYDSASKIYDYLQGESRLQVFLWQFCIFKQKGCVLFFCLPVSLTDLNTSLCHRAEIYFWSAEKNEVPKTVKSRLDPGPRLFYQVITVPV